MKISRKSITQQGFTLIELIITIVIIGVLAAVAIPRFQNLSQDAQVGVAAGVGSALASASSVNYARSVVPNAVACGAGTVLPAGCSYYVIATCAAISGSAAQLADFPLGYTIAGGALTGGATAPCTVTHTVTGASSTFNAYGT